jgi:anti-anti-sigma factor
MLTTFEPLGRDALLVSVFGDLSRDSAEALQERLFSLVDMGFRHTFLDMHGVRLLHWSCLDVLVACARRADRREVAVLAPSRELRRLLEATGLSLALPVYATRADAARKAVAVA